MGKLGTTTALALIGLSSGTGAWAQGQGQYSFNLPVESLSKALRDVAERTGRNVIAPADLLGNRQAGPLSGTFTAEEAVGRLLKGTGLRQRSVVTAAYDRRRNRHGRTNSCCRHRERKR